MSRIDGRITLVEARMGGFEGWLRHIDERPDRVERHLRLKAELPQ